MDEAVKSALLKIASLNFEGRPDQIPEIADLANQYPFPPVIVEIYNRIFYLFQKDSKGRSYPDRCALVQLATDLSYLLPRLDNITDPLRFSVHLIAAFDHSDPEVWILAYQLIRACALILRDCIEYYHFVTLGFFRSQQEVIAAVKLSQYLVRTSRPYPSYFIDWAADHFWELSHTCQRHVLTVMAHAQTTCLVLLQMKSFCRQLLLGPIEAGDEPITRPLSPFRTNESQNANESNQRSQITTWLNALILICITKSLSPTQEDHLHVTNAVEADHTANGPLSSTTCSRSTFLLVHALRAIVQFPKWLVTRYAENQQDLNRWFLHPHIRVRKLAYLLIVRICNHPEPYARMQFREILEQKVLFGVLSRTDANNGIVLPEQCRAILAMLNQHFYDPTQVFEWALNKLKQVTFQTNRHANHVRPLINVLVRVPIPLISVQRQLSSYLLEQIFRDQTPLPIRSLLAQLYARIEINARKDVGQGKGMGYKNEFYQLLSNLAKPGSFPQPNCESSGRFGEMIQFHAMRPWLMDPYAATAIIAFKPGHGTSFSSGSLAQIVCRWSAYRLCIEALTSDSTALEWFDIAFTTLTDLEREVTLYSHFAWLHHLSCLAKACLLNPGSILDECQQSARGTWLLESKSYIDRNLGDSSFQSLLLRMDCLFDEVLSNTRFKWMTQWKHLSDAMIQIGYDYLFLAHMFPEMNSASRKVLQCRSKSCMMVADWLRNENQPIDEMALRILPICYLVTESNWELKVLVTPSSSSQRPIRVNKGVDVTYYVYGQVLHRLDQKLMPSITEGQLITILSLKPQFISMKRDMRKQRQVSELVTSQSNKFQTSAMSQLGIIHFSESPLALHTNAFTKLGAIPYSVFEVPKEEVELVKLENNRSGPGNQREPRLSSTIYATLLVRFKLPESVGGEWWECGPVLNMVIQLM